MFHYIKNGNKYDRIYGFIADEIFNAPSLLMNLLEFSKENLMLTLKARSIGFTIDESFSQACKQNYEKEKQMEYFDEQKNVKVGYPVSIEMQKRLENTFTYHKPLEGQAQKYTQLRNRAKELAYLICTLTPPSREQSLALTELENCIFNANAAIARNEKPIDEDTNLNTKDS